MNEAKHQRAETKAVGYYAALATAALVCLASAALALLCFIKAHAADELQVVTPGDVLAAVQSDAEEQLKVAVALEPLHELPPITLPVGAVELTVRYPKHAGLYLPEAVECRVDGRLITSIALGQYVRFRLSVLTAPDGLPARALVDGAQLACEEQLLGAGTEVATLPGQTAGMCTRGLLPAGARVVLSRLMRPFDVARGSTVLLVIAMDGVRMEARAVALADGYIGQRLTVQRENDKKKYVGLVCADQQVVVE
jgi:flagella basal body P-ring formation protein FlgA